MISKPALTEVQAIEQLRSFFREKPLVVFGSGMSCALDTQFGMAALRDVLVTGMPTRLLGAEEERQWSLVHEALEDGDDLESALDAVTNYQLLKKITSATGSFISSVDRQYACRISTGDCKWPALELFQKLVDSLPSGDRALHVLTPNYDLLLEHSCDFAGIPYINGFTGGITRQLDWRAATYSLLTPARTALGRRLKITYKPRRHIRLYKVHGSLNYFFHRDAVIENNSWMWDPPEYAQRVLITPGLSKFQELQRYRQELLQSADDAIAKSSHFLFLGYGFNDQHLEEYITRKLVGQSCHGLIITQSPNSRMEELIAKAANLWLVCRAQEDGITRVSNGQYENYLDIPDCHLWDIEEFTLQILGG